MPDPVLSCPCGRVIRRLAAGMVVVCAACKGRVARVPPSAEVTEKERASG